MTGMVMVVIEVFSCEVVGLVGERSLWGCCPLAVGHCVGDRAPRK